MKHNSFFYALFLSITLGYLHLSTGYASCSAFIARQESDRIARPHRLPKTFEEFDQAQIAHCTARRMLNEGKGVEALDNIFIAEKFYMSDTLYLMWDVAHNRYPAIPREIQDYFKSRLPNLEIYHELIKTYEDMSTKAHIELIRKGRELTITRLMKNFRYNVASYARNLLQDNQVVDDPEQQINIGAPLLDINLKKDI